MNDAWNVGGVERICGLDRDIKDAIQLQRFVADSIAEATTD
jgi:hypothetical protein